LGWQKNHTLDWGKIQLSATSSKILRHGKWQNLNERMESAELEKKKVLV
jgi:hypothetical protein